MPVIELSGLRKEYRRFRRPPVVALDGLDLSVPEGGVFGFLGPNGSGKTTTIRCLLALARPSAGACHVLGVDSQTDLTRVIGRIGSMVETPGLFPAISGRKNLSLLGRVEGIGATAVAQVLDRVGLAERADDTVRGYSLGMRQRLGIAIALLKDPQLLILDEPANGLDPAGIKEVRELLRGLGAEGRTVFVSSHLLSEVQQTCDQVAVLARGRCVAAGPVDDVLSARRSRGLVVRLADLERGRAALAEAGIASVIVGGTPPWGAVGGTPPWGAVGGTPPSGAVGDHLRVDLPPAEAERVTRALVRKRLYLTELRPEEISLEAVFLDLTGEPHEEEPT